MKRAHQPTAMLPMVEIRGPPQAEMRELCKGTACGTKPVRVLRTSGLSGPFCFSVMGGLKRRSVSAMHVINEVDPRDLARI